MLYVQSRLDRNEKKVHALTVLVVGLMVVMFGLLVDKLHSLI